MSPAYTLHLGDCLDVLRGMDAGSVDAVVTDPPYGMAWNTDSTRFTGGKRKVDRGDGRSDWGSIHDDHKPFDPSLWLAFPKVILWGANHFAERLPVGTTLVWIKRADHLFGSFLSDAEIGWQKGGHGVYCFRKQFPPPSRMAESSIKGKVAHPNQKPVALMRWCIERLRLPEGSTILDPYMGSGTVGVAALQLGMNYIGCEIRPEYHAIASRRLAAAADAMPLFREAATSAPAQ